MNYSDYGIDIPHGRFSGEVVTTCPKCSADRKKKNIKCLGVNLDKKIWNCSHCGWKGALKIEREVIKYEKPKWKNNTELSDKVIKWFEGRKISQNTLIKAKISEGLEFMPQSSKECNTIQFNYFRGEELINIKFRTADKLFKFFKDAELIFYNIDCLKESKEVYIVEGEMDCLAMIEAGKLNVISVPNGANLNTNNLKYVDNCIELFNDIDKIHLAVDNDIAGRNLREQLSERFGKDKCDFIEFKDCKDANDCLMKYGIDGVIESCNNPKEFPLEGVFTISDYSDAIDDMYENGLDKGINLGIDGFDLNIVKGYITTITGIPSHGKSDWVDNICVHAVVKHGWNGAFYSPENKPTQLHFSKMARKLIGKHWDGDGKMNYLEVKLVKQFLDKKFWFLKPEKNFDLTSILTQVRSLQQRHGLDFFVIDAWNKLYHKETDTGAVGKSMDELALFCELNNVHCFLVAHPTKMPKEQDGKYQVPTLYNIAGSSNFYNKTDNGICVYRDFEHNSTIVYRQKVKFDHWGVEGQSEYIYDVPSKRYFPVGKADFTNWITKEEVQQTLQPNTSFTVNPNKHIEPTKDEDIYPF